MSERELAEVTAEITIDCGSWSAKTSLAGVWNLFLDDEWQADLGDMDTERVEEFVKVLEKRSRGEPAVLDGAMELKERAERAESEQSAMMQDLRRANMEVEALKKRLAEAEGERDRWSKRATDRLRALSESTEIIPGDKVFRPLLDGEGKQVVRAPEAGEWFLYCEDNLRAALSNWVGARYPIYRLIEAGEPQSANCQQVSQMTLGERAAVLDFVESGEPQSGEAPEEVGYATEALRCRYCGDATCRYFHPSRDEGCRNIVIACCDKWQCEMRRKNESLRAENASLREQLEAKATCTFTASTQHFITPHKLSAYEEQRRRERRDHEAMESLREVCCDLVYSYSSEVWKGVVMGHWTSEHPDPADAAIEAGQRFRSAKP